MGTKQPTAPHDVRLRIGKNNSDFRLMVDGLELQALGYTIQQGPTGAVLTVSVPCQLTTEYAMAEAVQVASGLSAEEMASVLRKARGHNNNSDDTTN